MWLPRLSCTTSIYLFLALLPSLHTSCRRAPGANPHQAKSSSLKVEILAEGIEVPFGMAFIAKDSLLVTDRRKGEIILLDLNSGTEVKLKGVPRSYGKGDGGILDILPHPDFGSNSMLYFSHSIGDSLASTTVITRVVLRGDSLVGPERIFTALPYYKGPNRYGSRMVFKDKYLFFTMGDRYDLADSAQTLGNHLGKTMRILGDGSIPSDNPFVHIPEAMPEIWSYGHRNPQGLALHPGTKQLWLHEHGPKGGDEINIIEAGKNYGWPMISYGTDYDDTPIGKGITHHPGMEQPLHLYTPSIAPSGMDFYFGDEFPDWKGSLLIGSLALRHLNRVFTEKGRFLLEERLLTDLEKRIRAVKVGPDGNIYLGVDGGMILRIKPG